MAKKTGRVGKAPAAKLATVYASNRPGVALKVNERELADLESQGLTITTAKAVDKKGEVDA